MLPSRLALPSLMCALALQAACTYVSRERLEGHIDCLDLDGDGAPQGVCRDPDHPRFELPVDCNDDPTLRGAEETPGAPEIPYDGLDNDCSLSVDGEHDRIDADGDDYPGLSRAAWEALGTRLAARWPTDLLGDTNTVDCVDDPSVANAARIHPKPIAQEVWYDGVDENCDGLDDFDADQDGYAADVCPDPANPGNNVPCAPLYATFSGAPWHRALPGGDCEDVNAAVHPGFSPAEDAPYDGVDKDCDGANDFDNDQDGFIPTRVQTSGGELTGLVALCEAFQIKYGLLGECTPDDCDDDPLTGAAVHPGAIEVWYDGLDQDCDGGDDFDADQDGFIPTDAATAYATHADAPWHRALPAGDCDDQDPAARPGEDERFGDAVDQDCDGDRDTTPFVFADFEVERPLAPVITANDHHLVLGVSAHSWSRVSTPNNFIPHAGLALFFDASGAANGAVPSSDTRWDSRQVSGIPIPAFDLIADGERFVVAHVEDREIQRRLTVSVQRRNPTTGTYAATPHLGTLALTTPVAGLDLAEDEAGVLWAYACGPQSTHFAAINPVGSPALVGRAEQAAVGGERCWLDFTDAGPVGSGWSATSPAGTRSYRLITSPEAGFATTPPTWDLDALRGVSTQAGTYAFALGTAGLLVSDGLVERRHLTAYDVRHASARLHGGGLFVLAVVADVTGDGVEDLVFAHGPPAGPLREVRVPFVHPRHPQRPAHTSLHVDDDWIAMAVSGLRQTPSEVPRADSVGWAFVRRP